MNEELIKYMLDNREKQKQRILEAKKFLEDKQEEHFKIHGVYFDTNSKIAEIMEEYAEIVCNKKSKEVPKRILSKEDVLKYRHYLTVGDLKKHLETYKYNDYAKVIVERVEDVYYQNGGWGVYLNEGQFYHEFSNFNKDMLNEIELRKTGKEPQYPGIENPLEYMRELGDDLKEQFTPAWCVSGRTQKEKLDLMFIYMHY